MSGSGVVQSRSRKSQSSLGGACATKLPATNTLTPAGWALPSDQLAPFQTLVAKYAPTHPIMPVAALFGTRALDYTGDFTKGGQEWRAGLLRLSMMGARTHVGLAGSVRGYRTCSLKRSAVQGLTAAQKKDLLSRSLDEDPGFLVNSGYWPGSLRQMVGAEDAEVWLRSAAANGSLDAEAISTVLQAWPDRRETWSAVRRFGPECVTAYWMRRVPG